jgi:transglutaminase-like putative cysteine protease
VSSSRLSRRAWLGAAAGAFLFGGRRARAEDAVPLMDAIPVTIEGQVDLTAPIVVSFYREDVPAFAAELKKIYGDVQPGAGRVDVQVSHYTPAAAAKPQGPLRPSFLLDYDDPAFADVKRGLAARAGAEPSTDAIEAFARDYITTKDRQRGFDIASTVARRREGDCTEHAVLLAALTRACGTPARVVMGTAVVEMGGKIGGYGHAWSEAWVSGRWRAIDAALPPSQPVVRLPLFAVVNETAGFAAAATGRMQAMFPRQVALRAL